MQKLPTPHFEKLNATLKESRLPESDRLRIEGALEKYALWVKGLKSVNQKTTEKTVKKMVQLLNEYRNYLDIDVIFDSENDYLYRQKGQTKLDNSVIEEFLPHLVEKCILSGDSDHGGLYIGPSTALSALNFKSSPTNPGIGGNPGIRKKDQDFAISRQVFLKTSYSSDFEGSHETNFNIAYLAAECKTNLDKTMFQEASATAADVKLSVQGARYFLLCEWLDMTPQSVTASAIDEVLILRKAKRMSANLRKDFASVAGRRKRRQEYIDFLNDAPFSAEVFERFVNHISSVMEPENLSEGSVLDNGYF